jgi:hypothetical protein
MASSGIGIGAPNFTVGSHIPGAASGGDLRASGEELTCPHAGAIDNKSAPPKVPRHALITGR